MKPTRKGLSTIVAAMCFGALLSTSAKAGLIDDEITIRRDGEAGLGQLVTVVDPGIELLNSFSPAGHAYTIDVFDDHILAHIIVWDVDIPELSLDFQDLNVGGTLVGVTMVDLEETVDTGASLWILPSFIFYAPVFTDFGNGTSAISIDGIAPAVCIGLCIVPNYVSFRLNLEIEDGGANDDDVIPVPAPGTLGLFGFGLAGLGVARRKRLTR